MEDDFNAEWYIERKAFFDNLLELLWNSVEGQTESQMALENALEDFMG